MAAGSRSTMFASQRIGVPARYCREGSHQRQVHVEEADGPALVRQDLNPSGFFQPLEMVGD